MTGHIRETIDIDHPTTRSNHPGTSPNFLITLASLKSPRLWQRSNNIFVSAPKPLILFTSTRACS
jgi:hypothetical protein